MEETDSAVVAMAAELTQDQVSWTRRERDAVSFRCTNTDQCESLQVLSRARLASVLYTVMVVKSVLCCCGLALLLLHTNKTSRTPRTSTTTALD
ncbi:unnamed protein product [Gadus morhua 'NCC']